MTDKPEITDSDKAYAAGIIDGEGYIGTILSSHKYPHLTVIVAMDYSNIPAWLKQVFGGTYRVDNVNSARGATYAWQLHGKACGSFLALVRPFLKLKTRQADVGQLMVSTIRNGNGERLDERSMLLRWKLHDLMKSLNKTRSSVKAEIASEELAFTPTEALSSDRKENLQ